jgi:hypothetical protein
MQPPTTRASSRIGLMLCLILGTAWGFLLGALIVRINSMHSMIQVFGVALPLAFVGSMLVGIAFNRMLSAWKITRVLIATIAVSSGLPLGFLWGLAEQWLSPVQLFAESGELVWYVEALFIVVGLLGGMWPKWTLPFLRPVGNLLHALLEPPARFFESVGHAIAWLPTRIVRFIANGFAALGEAWTHLPTITLPQRAPRPTDPLPPTRRSKKIRTPKSPPPVAASQTASDGLRVMGVIEDRCPYCFDIVKRSDPRGVHVCPTCGTPHHADCWAITGKCQMPHLNT